MKAPLAIALASGILLAAPEGSKAVSLASSSGPMLTNRASFDGRRLLLAGGSVPGAASLWDVETGLRIQEFVGHTEPVFSVALSPDGRQVLTGAGSSSMFRRSSDNSMRLWDISSGRELRRFNRMTYPAALNRDPVTEVAFSDNGREVLGLGAGVETALAIWDADTAELLFEQPAPRQDGSVSFCGSSVMTRQRADSIRISDYRTGTTRSVTRSDLLAAWKSAGGSLPRRSIGSPTSETSAGRVMRARCSSDGSAVVIASGNMASTWNTVTGRLERAHLGHTNWVWDVMFSANGQQVVSASSDGSVHLWDRTSGALLGQLVHDEGSVSRALISPNGNRVLTEWTHGRSGRLTSYSSLWDVDSGKELARFEQSRRPLGFSPDGRTIPTVTLNWNLDATWDAATGQPVRSFQR